MSALRMYAVYRDWHTASGRPDLVGESEHRAALAGVLAAELDGFEGMRVSPPVADPYGPDPAVFGNGHKATLNYGDLVRTCRPCGVQWAYGAGKACWICGSPATEF